LAGADFAVEAGLAGLEAGLAGLGAGLAEALFALLEAFGAGAGAAFFAGCLGEVLAKGGLRGSDGVADSRQSPRHIRPTLRL
jgi:hypothetical protein